MIKNYENYSPTESYSDFDESFFNDSVGQSTSFDYEHMTNDKSKETEISDSDLLKLCVEHYFTNYLSNFVIDKPSYFLLQAELFLNLRMYKDALSAALVFERLLKPNIVSKSIKMICFYQLNFNKNFGILKDEIMSSNVDAVSESLRKNVIGTIQVSTWMPQFMNCINNMKTQS